MNRKLLIIGIFALLGAVLVAGCVEDLEGVGDGAGSNACETNDDCPPDFLCSAGECVPSGDSPSGTGSIT